MFMDTDIIGTKKDHGTKKKNPFQLGSLEKYYSDDKYPKPSLMEEYATSLNLTYSQIRTWFIERRRKERRENEIHGCSKRLLGVQLKYGSVKDGKKMSVNNFLGRSRPKTSINSRRNKVMNQESDQSVDIMLSAGNKSCRLNEKQATSNKKNHTSSSKQGEIKYTNSSRCYRPCNPRSTMLMRKCHDVFKKHSSVSHKNHHMHLQVLLSKDYILKRVFHKDGPPLGAEFDSRPCSSFGFQTDSGILHPCRDSERALKKRKILCSPITEPGNIHKQNVPSKKYGIGKGLMTVWRATNLNNVKRPSEIKFVDGGQVRMSFESSVKETLCRASKGGQQLNLVPRHCNWQKKLQEKRRPAIKRRKVPCHKEVKQTKIHWTMCTLLLDEPVLEPSNDLEKLVDDEELELRELEEGPNPLRCSAHFAFDGRHGCPLCKDLLAKFPPQTVKMKQPFDTRPWDTSPERVKKLFKVLRFLYSNAATLEMYPFTLEDLAFAFTDKDSMLLGKIYVALLDLLLLDLQRHATAGLISRASKDCRFLGFLHFVREREIDVSTWIQSPNPLTWTEILRQVLVAAGFGSKSYTARRDIFSKERNQMAKYGLHPRTLKGELFSILLDQGSGGLKVSELANSTQVVALELPNTKDETEELIYSTLSSDITLFEKIAPCAYRLRINPDIKGMGDFQSDSDSGCVHDDSGGSSCSSSDDESDCSKELNSAGWEQRIIVPRDHHKQIGQKLTEYTEIDESYSGESYVLGLMEGEYSDLSIDEKLDALTALIDLTSACSSLRTEEPSKVIPEAIHNTLYHGSGAKIKKSLMYRHQIQQEQEIISIASKKGQSSKTKSTKDKDELGHEVHPMQSIYLGSDRRYNKYWLFLGPCDIIDPGHRQVYFESSEDGHWEVINTSQALDALLSTLDCRGTREARLFKSINKREAFLCQAMDKFMTTECINMQTGGYCPAESNSSGDGSSPISDVDNILDSTETTDNYPDASSAAILEHGKNNKEKKQKWDRLQAYDRWVWNGFYSGLNAVKRMERSCMESLARCERCHDLYWRDEKHCWICHATFELDFDLEEKYAIHVATCRAPEDSCDFPKHKILPSQLQALKAASHAIEAGMPEVALSDTWTRSAHKLWVRRLQRTSSLSEFLQVLADFVGAIKEGWLKECAAALGANAASDDIVVSFQTMPQTTSAVALWLVKLDALIAPLVEKVQSEPGVKSRPQRKRKS